MWSVFLSNCIDGDGRPNSELWFSLEAEQLPRKHCRRDLSIRSPLPRACGFLSEHVAIWLALTLLIIAWEWFRSTYCIGIFYYGSFASGKNKILKDEDENCPIVV